MSETGLISAVNRNQDTVRALHSAKSHVAPTRKSPEADLSTESGISQDAGGQHADTQSQGDSSTHERPPEDKTGSHIDLMA